MGWDRLRHDSKSIQAYEWTLEVAGGSFLRQSLRLGVDR